VQRTEQRAHDDRIGVLVAARPTAGRTVLLLGQARADLLADDDCLYSLEQVLGLGQL